MHPVKDAETMANTNMLVDFLSLSFIKIFNKIKPFEEKPIEKTMMPYIPQNSDFLHFSPCSTKNSADEEFMFAFKC